MLKTILILASASIAMTGCANLFRTTPAGCEALISTTVGSFSVAGVVIPTGALNPVKIGNATYTPQQIQRLTDSAQQMEQYRLGQCAVLSTLERLKPQPIDKIATVAEKIAQMNLDMQKLFHELPKAAEPEKQVQTAEKIVSDIQKEQTPPQTGAQGSNGDEVGSRGLLTSGSAQHVTELKELIQQLNSLTTTLRESSKAPTPVNNIIHTAEIAIVGFSSGSYEMTTRMKANLLADISIKLHDVPQGKQIALDVLGYSDTVGRNNKNVELALRRAQAVAGFLTEQQSLPNAKLRSVVSAGSVEIPPFGRQVRIILNSVPYASRPQNKLAADYQSLISPSS